MTGPGGRQQPSPGTGDAPAVPTPDLLEVGQVGKPHGLKGELVVSWTTNLVERRTMVGTRLLAGDRWLTVQGARPHQDRWLLRFDEVVDRAEAELIRGSTLRAEPIESEGQVFVHELVGLTLVDQHGTEHGTVTSLVANPASDLIELDDGSLVPFAFYRSHGAGRVTVEVPPGLLDGDDAG